MSLLKTGDGHPRGPNLLSLANVAASEADGNRILSQLEHGAIPAAAPVVARWRPTLPRAAMAAAAVGAAALIVAVLVYAPESAPPLKTNGAATPHAAAVTAVTAVPSISPQQLPTAATIINEAAPPAVPALATTMPAPRKTPPGRQATVRRPAPRPATTAPGDSDVALLTAMVAHAHRQEGTAAPVRDVVLRKEEEETASLLQRCKQLGLIEGMLCRSRICSGRWDSDSACH
ncbi:hypothetical protein [Janthinobacterium sp. HLX7-2]|uniref:hypothetical protein n=1 Tax=Janthinobacterium sp. HLX7-2 TaxID=1259331 RepID=UPI003F1E7F64